MRTKLHMLEQQSTELGAEILVIHIQKLMSILVGMLYKTEIVPRVSAVVAGSYRKQ